MSIPESTGGHKGVDTSQMRSVGQGGLLDRISHDWVLVGCILLFSALCFGLGLLAGKEESRKGDSLWIEQLPASELPGSVSTSTAAHTPPAATTPSQQKDTTPGPQPAAAASVLPAAAPQTGTYVASKTGTKYYLPTCSTAKRIKDENKVWFATKSEAESAGYTPAANCPGL